MSQGLGASILFNVTNEPANSTCSHHTPAAPEDPLLSPGAVLVPAHHGTGYAAVQFVHLVELGRTSGVVVNPFKELRTSCISISRRENRDHACCSFSCADIVRVLLHNATFFSRKLLNSHISNSPLVGAHTIQDASARQNGYYGKVSFAKKPVYHHWDTGKYEESVLGEEMDKDAWIKANITGKWYDWETTEQVLKPLLPEDLVRYVRRFKVSPFGTKYIWKWFKTC